ncbi:unnamed protein product [Rotaria socialis]|uniref:Uncharacterized protein n=1 Tax=Rotaria socialis TaxID=392032 RepID=A0A817WVD3_9BILA|nr:unnamed protein product [Rotaria socialis]
MDFLRIFTIKPIDADDMASQQTQSYLKTSLSRSTWQAWESITVIPCLTKDRLSIYSLHRQACLNHRSFYTDPTTKLQVLTRYAHLQRGNCCGNRCRHMLFTSEIGGQQISNDEHKIWYKYKE